MSLDKPALWASDTVFPLPQPDEVMDHFLGKKIRVKFGIVSRGSYQSLEATLAEPRLREQVQGMVWTVEPGCSAPYQHVAPGRMLDPFMAQCPHL